MIKSQITDYKTKFNDAKAILDGDLSATNINQQQYDTYYPIVDGLYNKNLDLETTLSQQIGHKEAGNFGTVDEIYDNPDKTMTEIVKNSTKYDLTSGCKSQITDSVSNVDLTVTTLGSLSGITVPTFLSSLDIFNWCDTNASTFTPLVDTLTTSVNISKTNIEAMRTGVKNYLNSSLSTAQLVSQHVLSGSSCESSIANQALKYKDPTDTEFIESLNSGDLASKINSKLDTFKL